MWVIIHEHNITPICAYGPFEGIEAAETCRQKYQDNADKTPVKPHEIGDYFRLVELISNE